MRARREDLRADRTLRGLLLPFRIINICSDRWIHIERIDLFNWKKLNRVQEQLDVLANRTDFKRPTFAAAMLLPLPPADATI